MNVQHDCYTHKCALQNTKAIRQEREKIKTHAPEVIHINLDDVILNCGQMRNSEHLETFRFPAPLVNREDCIYQGAVAEFEDQRAKQRANSNVSSSKSVMPRRSPARSIPAASTARTRIEPWAAISRDLNSQSIALTRIVQHL